MLRYIKDKKKLPSFRFSPDFICNSITSVDFGYLKDMGITACFIDLDGTTVSRSTYEVDPAISNALKKSGLDFHIATNRPKSRDLKNLKESLHAKSVIHPQGLFPKPSKRYYLDALKKLQLEPKQVVMIGDRYIQDILGANRSGIYSLLVYKLGGSKGTIDTLLSRFESNMTEKISKHYKPVN